MILSKIFSVFAAAPHIKRLPAADINQLYPRYRRRIMESTFLGYAAFYLVRNNLSVVAKDIEGALHYDHSMIGSILALTAISYGLGKFLMGSLSDRSDPRKFMAVGLLLTACLNFAFGSVSSYGLHMLLWSANGFVQGMGWPPCGRSMGHWFSEKECGLTFSIGTHHIISAAESLGFWQLGRLYILAVGNMLFTFLELLQLPVLYIYFYDYATLLNQLVYLQLKNTKMITQKMKLNMEL